MSRPEDAAAHGSRGQPPPAPGDPRTYDYSQPEAPLRRRDEGRDHERRRLPPRALRDRADVPVRERRRDVRRRDRGRRRRRRRARSRARRVRRSSRRCPTGSGRARTSSGSSSRSRGTRPFFRLFTAGLGRTGAGKWLRVGIAALRSFPLASLAGIAPGIALVVLALVEGSGVLAVAAIVAGHRPGAPRARARARPPSRRRTARGSRPEPVRALQRAPVRRRRGPRPDAVARRPDRRPRGEGRRRAADVRRPPREGDRARRDDDEPHAPPPPPDALGAPRAPLRPGRDATSLPGAGRGVDGDASAGGRRGPRRRAAPAPPRGARAAPTASRSRTTCPSSSRPA